MAKKLSRKTKKTPQFQAILSAVTRGILTSIIGIAVFMAGIFVITDTYPLSHMGLHSFLLFSIPLFVYSYYKHVTSFKQLLLESLVTSLWIVTPISILIGWFFATTNFFDEAIQRSFELSTFMGIGSLFFLFLFLLVSISLILGGGTKLYRQKKTNNNP